MSGFAAASPAKHSAAIAGTTLLEGQRTGPIRKLLDQCKEQRQILGPR